MAAMLLCTCREPECVDLSTSSSHNTIIPVTQKKLLLSNLQASGWSPIRISATKDFPIGLPPTHEQIKGLFVNDKGECGQLSHHPLLTYRSQESGGTEQAIEPKESLELDRVHADEMFREENHEKIPINLEGACLVKGWCLGLSEIARRMSQILGLPCQTFTLDEEPSSDRKEFEGNCLDLLRVFFYHATNKPDVLGSSPHTDWGSWTVVWQDDVGGLETYCRGCHKWVAISAATRRDTSDDCNAWDCIVHLGDVASLALGSSFSSSRETGKIQWPSPRHRVVSSIQERTSLVYFAYPPASCSILDIQDSLQQWRLANNPRGLRLPLDEYYLLNNQSNLSATGITSDDMLREIEYLSIGEVIQTKWNQVQRNSG